MFQFSRKKSTKGENYKQNKAKSEIRKKYRKEIHYKGKNKYTAKNERIQKLNQTIKQKSKQITPEVKKIKTKKEKYTQQNKTNIVKIK